MDRLNSVKNEGPELLEDLSLLITGKYRPSIAVVKVEEDEI
jgi:hypothetical protein